MARSGWQHRTRGLCDPLGSTFSMNAFSDTAAVGYPATPEVHERFRARSRFASHPAARIGTRATQRGNIADFDIFGPCPFAPGLPDAYL